MKFARSRSLKQLRFEQKQTPAMAGVLGNIVQEMRVEKLLAGLRYVAGLLLRP